MRREAAYSPPSFAAFFSFFFFFFSLFSDGLTAFWFSALGDLSRFSFFSCDTGEERTQSMSSSQMRAFEGIYEPWISESALLNHVHMQGRTKATPLRKTAKRCTQCC